jgi:hypothetical protein
MTIKYAALCSFLSLYAYGMMEEVNEDQAQDALSKPRKGVVRLKFSGRYPERWFCRGAALTLNQTIFFVTFTQAIVSRDTIKAFICYNELIKSLPPDSPIVREAQSEWQKFICPVAAKKPPVPPYEDIPLDSETQ